MTVTTYRRTRYQRLIIGNVTILVSAIGVDPEGIGWVRLLVETLDGVPIIAPEREWQVNKRHRRRARI